MGKDSKIEWTHHTFNPWWGCTKVSDGCRNCYAETLASRWGKDIWGVDKPRQMMSESYWKQPIKWNREAEKAGERRRVFCASMADVFEGYTTMPASDYRAVDTARFRLFELIEQTPQLDWLLLTKRPQNIMDSIPAAWRVGHMPNNVWIGTSIEDQQTADERIPHLLRVPAAVRFLSCEPLLGPVDLTYPTFNGADSLSSLEGIHWCIVGGESGPGARPMHPDWARSLRNQCEDAGVAFNFKQWGEWLPGSQNETEALRGTLHEWDDEFATKLGKHAAGRLLDGREWNEFPQAVNLATRQS